MVKILHLNIRKTQFAFLLYIGGKKEPNGNAYLPGRLFIEKAFAEFYYGII